MLAVLATALPMCYFVVATDAPNPTAIFKHEEAHCWGWSHAPHEGPRAPGYQAYKVPRGYRAKPPYPRGRLVVEFMTMEEVRKVCGPNAQFGCQWGGVK